MSTPVLEEFWRKLEIQTGRIATALQRVPAAALWTPPREGMNSIGNLCLHLAGNESHYLGHCVGGLDYERDRASEFRSRDLPLDELHAKLAAARKMTRQVFDQLDEAALFEEVATDHPPPRATRLRIVTHVFEHFAYHTGQVVLLARLLQEGEERVLEWGH